MTARADQLLADIDEVLAWADENLPRAAKRRHEYGAPRGGRGGYFTKATGLDDEGDEDGSGASAHAETKADHHEKMAEYHAKIADQHHSMADHYSAGAKGAHNDDAEDEAIRSPIEQVQDDEPTDARSIVAKCLRTGHHVGDPSAAGFFLVRAREQERS